MYRNKNTLCLIIINKINYITTMLIYYHYIIVTELFQHFIYKDG